MRPPLERDIQRVCLDWMRLVGIFPVRVNSGAFGFGGDTGKKRFMRFNSEPGCSDCLAVLPGGRFLAVEFKRPGNKPTPHQSSFLEAVKARGGLALVVTGLDDLRKQLHDAGVQVVQ